MKKVLVFLGLRHPALGVKLSGDAKAAAILSHKTPQILVFVETGTEYGTMIERVGRYFEKIYTIEYDASHYQKAVEHFRGKENITLFHGDSGEEIKKVLSELSRPALFWLDAHGPGSMTITNPVHCPAEKELKAIFEHHVSGHVILIDDARHFDMQSIRTMETLARSKGYTFILKDGLFILKQK